ncbi:hypothetical protein HY992_03830 [Candidatus Micrarchaeota archaeon]|nr:hypothetical protein [Candidatus Micrarchaeota archaeon]
MDDVGALEKSNAFLDVDSFRKSVLSARKRLDYSMLLKGVRVAYFGEPHDSACVKKEFIRNMDVFKNAGVTHVCLEHFASGIQEKIELYNPINGQGRDLLEEHLKEKKLECVKMLIDLVDAVKKNNLQFAALGISVEYGKALEYEYNDVNGVCTAKEKHMAEVVAGALRGKASKAIVLTGAPYAQKNHLNAQVEKLAGTSGLSVRLVGCVKNAESPEWVKAANNAVRGEGLARDSFSIQLKNIAGAPKFDCLVHLPQVEEAKTKKKKGGLLSLFSSFFKKKNSGIEEEFSEENSF